MTQSMEDLSDWLDKLSPEGCVQGVYIGSHLELAVLSPDQPGVIQQ